jgi:hypothetical protein
MPGGEFCNLRSPVKLSAPIIAEIANKGGVHSVFPLRSGYFIRPTCAPQPVLQVA